MVLKLRVANPFWDQTHRGNIGITVVIFNKVWSTFNRWPYGVIAAPRKKKIPFSLICTDTGTYMTGQEI